MKILDYTTFCAAEDVKKLLYQQWLGLCAQDTTPSHYYCGITNDPDRRKEQHESELGETINYLCVCKCASSEIAGEVEELMAKKGFDIGDVDFGGNGGAEDSVYVYLFKK